MGGDVVGKGMKEGYPPLTTNTFRHPGETCLSSADGSARADT